MNETLKRRLTGLAVILLGLLVVSALLPGPESGPAGDGALRRVTLDLHEPPASVSVTPLPTPVPPAIAAVPAVASPVAVQAPVDMEPDLEVPPPPASASAVVAPAAPAVTQPKVVVTTPAKPKPRPAAPRWYVQLGAFSDADNARQLLRKFANTSSPGVVSPADTSKGVRYRVWIGPYGSRDLATAAQQRLIKAGAKGTALVQG